MADARPPSRRSSHRAPGRAPPHRRRLGDERGPRGAGDDRPGRVRAAADRAGQMVAAAGLMGGRRRGARTGGDRDVLPGDARRGGGGGDAAAPLVGASDSRPQHYPDRRPGRAGGGGGRACDRGGVRGRRGRHPVDSRLGRRAGGAGAPPRAHHPAAGVRACAAALHALFIVPPTNALRPKRRPKTRKAARRHNRKRG